MSDFVPEEELDYDEIYRRGGHNCGDENFALFRCPSCDRVYMMEYEVDTVYVDGRDLTIVTWSRYVLLALDAADEIQALTDGRGPAGADVRAGGARRVSWFERLGRASHLCNTRRGGTDTD